MSNGLIVALIIGAIVIFVGFIVIAGLWDVVKILVKSIGD